MTIQELLQYADNQVFEKTGKHLDSLQKSILEGVLNFQSYQQIAINNNYNYSDDYIKEKGAQLWKILSQVLQKDIKKINIRSILENKISSNVDSCIEFSQTQLSSNYFNNISNNQINICGKSKQFLSEDFEKNLTVNKHNKIIDLSQAPILEYHYERNEEVLTLQKWINQDKKLINIYGLSGIGKTALVLKLIKQIETKFDYIIYRSLDNMPDLTTLKNDLHKIFINLSNQEFSDIIDYFKLFPSLIIIDDVENIFKSGELAGKYISEYSNYSQFFKQILTNNHRSSLLLISAEKMPNIKNIEYLHLQGLGKSARNLLQENQLNGDDKWDDLINLYQGNPSWLNIIIDTINNLFDGNVSNFLSDQNHNENDLFLGDIKTYLEWHLQRLSSVEIKVLKWFVEQNRPINLSQKLTNMDVSNTEFRESIESLMKRCLLDKIIVENITYFELNNIFKIYCKKIEN